MVLVYNPLEAHAMNFILIPALSQEASYLLCSGERCEGFLSHSHSFKRSSFFIGCLN